jgi:hypothetical protein
MAKANEIPWGENNKKSQISIDPRTLASST